jgi:hypothetical protein
VLARNADIHKRGLCYSQYPELNYWDRHCNNTSVAHILMCIQRRGLLHGGSSHPPQQHSSARLRACTWCQLLHQRSLLATAHLLQQQRNLATAAAAAAAADELSML